MKNKILLLLIFSIVSQFGLMAQQYNLELANFTNDGTQTCVDIKISFTSATTLASSNFVFTFSQTEFSNTNATMPTFTPSAALPPQFSSTVGVPSPGLVDVGLVCIGAFGCPGFDPGVDGCNATADIGTLCFTNVDATVTDPGFAWDLTQGDGTPNETVIFEIGNAEIDPNLSMGVNTPTACVSDTPVELSVFNVKPDNAAISLEWKSSSEIDFNGYELQRSLDGSNFDKIAWVQGLENTLEERQYNYSDLNVKGGLTYYYRLKMIDLDESFEFSPIRSAQVGGKGEAIAVAPNPTSEAVNLTIDVPKDDRVNIRFFDATGKVALERVQDLNEGNNALQFDVTGLPTGLYRIVVAGSQIRATQSVVIMD